MNQDNTGRILAAELGRVLAEFRSVGEQAERLAAETERLAEVGRRLLFLLRELLGEPATTRLIRDAGLADLVATLPAAVGEKPAPAAQPIAPAAQPIAPAAQPIAPVAKPTVAALPSRAPGPEGAAASALGKGTPLRMLTGKYEGWTGRVQSIHMNGRNRTYTVVLRSPEGRAVPNQLSQRSLGKKWEVVADAHAAPDTTDLRRGRRPASAAVGRTSDTEAKAVLAKRTPVRLLSGKYAGTLGEVGYTTRKGATITYTIYLSGKDGKRGRTQVNQGSLGSTWQILETAGADSGIKSAAVRERRPIRRRGSQVAMKVATTGSDGSADRPTKAAPPSLVVPRGTRVRVLKGMYQGESGVVGYTQARGTAVVYTLNIGGHRTQVNHGTLGSTWVLEPEAEPGSPVSEPKTIPNAPTAAPVAETKAAPVSAPHPAPVSSAGPVAPRGVLGKGTQIKMLTGHYLGCRGVVTGAHAIPGPKPDAIYTVDVTDAGGGTVRTSMKHSSLGRAWIKAE